MWGAKPYVDEDFGSAKELGLSTAMVSNIIYGTRARFPGNVAQIQLQKQ